MSNLNFKISKSVKAGERPDSTGLKAGARPDSEKSTMHREVNRYIV
jgi:hypothetical protein